ncbi:hypothetical protein K439DRAFT_1659799 [Ramaria rubella]|nr:hypothetical protein K439DRAFT_1659799 [Ramaria rubella]
MTTRRPSFAPSPRPSSAIFIGGGLPPLPLPSPPSPARSSASTHSQLPSPPATASGSTGDSNSTSAGSVRRAGMPNVNRLSSLSDDDDDDIPNHDEDDTARLSNDRRPGKTKESDYNSSTLQRVKSLTERNRKVIDKLSSITSPEILSRSSLSTPSDPSNTSLRSRSPLPPTFSSSSSSSAASSSSRVSFAHSPRGSGSETEREQQHPDRIRPFPRDTHPHLPIDNDATTPPATARHVNPLFERTGPRQRLISAPSSPAKVTSPLPPNSPRKHPSTSFAVIGSGRRSRRVSIQQPNDDEEFHGPPQTANGSANKKSRAPLPREFRDRMSLDGRSVEEGSAPDREHNTSPGVLVARGAASPHSSGAAGTFSSPTSPRSQRPARPSTVRESSRRGQRWSSVDEASLNGNGNSLVGDEDNGRRQWRQSGSAESPLGGREGRSLVNEGLRAAGLAPRGSEDVFVDGVPRRRTRVSGGLESGINGSREGEGDALRRGVSRVSLGKVEDERERDPRTPPSATGSSRFGTARNIHSVLSNSSSRAATSLASYGGDEDNSRNLRSYRSSYILPERTASRLTPQHERSHTSPYGRSTPHLQPASSEHARLMLDSLTMFEAQLTRIPSSSSAPDLSRVAQSVVQSANGLNTLLRAGNAHALEAQIEAEVGEAAAQVDASEVWRQVGGEYRESLRVSDELVRTVTALLLGIGRLVREAVKERGTDSPDVSGGGGGSGRSSLDESDRAMRASRGPTEVGGRRSVEGLTYRESRRSWEDNDGSMRRARVDLGSRPSTSLSMTRDRDRELAREDDGDETAREKGSSALQRLSIRRMFTSRARDPILASPVTQTTPDHTLPSPSPASRISQDSEHRVPHRSLPPLAVPPPLPSLPSEADRKNSTRSRRAKFSNTSNATVRGASSIFPAINSPNPTTALSAHTVNASGEVTSFPLLRTETTALSGLQQQHQRDVRKRSDSAVSVEDVSGSSGSSGRILRSSRVRMSLDGTGLESTSPERQAQGVHAIGSRRERRRTINDILPSVT